MLHDGTPQLFNKTATEDAAIWLPNGPAQVLTFVVFPKVQSKKMILT